jgi:hypothetical protein
MPPFRQRAAFRKLFHSLEAFWSEWFRSEKGEFKAAFQNFPSTDAFEQQVELELRGARAFGIARRPRSPGSRRWPRSRAMQPR